MHPLTTALLATLMLSACAVPPPLGEEPAKLISGPIPVKTATPATEALKCLGRLPRPPMDLRLAVGDIPDRTGRFNYQEIGAYVTQGATHMLISSLSAARVPQVNRSTTAIMEFELAQALNQRLGEGRVVQAGSQSVMFRPIPKGMVLGSTHYVTGAITELDFKVVNNSAEVTIAGIGAGAKSYAVQIGLDLAVTDTRTSQIVYSKAWRKQAVGYETSANLFRFFDLGVKGGAFAGDVLFDISIGEQPTEPLQGAIRWAIESAAYDIVSELYRTGAACDQHLTTAARERRDAEHAEAERAAAAMPIGIAEPQVARRDEALNAVPAEAKGNAAPPPSLSLDRVPERQGCRMLGGRMVCDR
ncbi:CsgG/HfaB family protein [Azospirillum sp.]|uniref:CsgG/HfaB family protein n=1 Tax=Azospirillum sp. TaxID=34012 RepID=UPI002D25AAF6|nr:CsgG/HfaB family protein [Azospirillum sp.]HYD68347.1 CsgG/HfaB family protein [Azospirillum sp.]